MIALENRAHLRAAASDPDLLVVSIAPHDLLALLDATEPPRLSIDPRGWQRLSLIAGDGSSVVLHCAANADGHHLWLVSLAAPSSVACSTALSLQAALDVALQEAVTLRLARAGA